VANIVPVAPGIVRRERGLCIEGTRVTLYTIMEEEYRMALRQAEERRKYWEERNRERLAEIVIDIDTYRGVTRPFIPYSGRERLQCASATEAGSVGGAKVKLLLDMASGRRAPT
jgi:hypothetical protein